MICLGLYALVAAIAAWLFYDRIDKIAWMAPRWMVVVLSVLGGSFWWLVLLGLLVAWVREERRRG